MKHSQDLAIRERELENCGFVKTVLMIIIVFYHSILFWSESWFVGEPILRAPILGEIAAWLNSFHIYGFVLVSGYIYSCLKYEKDKYERFDLFVLNKVKRLLVPFVFVAIIWVIPIGTYFFNWTWHDFAVKFAMATSPNQLWFLVMLFVVFIVFWPLSSFVKKHTVASGLVVCVMFCCGFVLGRFINVFQISTALTYMPLFWLGIKIRQYGSDIIMKIPAVLWILLDLVLFVVERYIVSGNSIIERVLDIALTFALHIVGAIMIFVVLQKIAIVFNEWKQNKAFMFLNRNSMQIYLFHQQVIYFSIVLLNGKVNPYIHGITNFLVSLIVSLTISFVLTRFKTLRFLLGEK